jgi:hypothetical protein
MQRRPLVIQFVVVPTIVVDIVMFGFGLDAPDSGKILAAIAFALFMSQVALLALWSGFGQSSLWIKIAAWCAANVFAVALSGEVRIIETVLLFACPYSILLTVVGGASHFCGWTLIQGDREIAGLQNGLGHKQFSLQRLFLLTTAVAVLAGLSRFESWWWRWIPVAFFLVPPGLALVAMLTVLCDGRLLTRMACLTGTTAVVGYACGFRDDSLGRWWWFAWTVLCALLIAGPLVVCRLAGYRFVRRRRQLPTKSYSPAMPQPRRVLFREP